jgi:hypothetical protein
MKDSSIEVQASLPLGSIMAACSLILFFVYVKETEKERDRGEIIIVWRCVRVSADEAVGG